MEYLLVRWQHESADEPVELLSELSEGRWETRKVEIFPDGRRTAAASRSSAVGFADEREHTGTTRLGTIAVPSNEKIAAQPEFTVLPLDPGEFELEWLRARRDGGAEAGGEE